ncbi:hypothetical protein NL529_29315, partial [Klebsiella pneumoniae]|nr:hypothetical protein [Klebsiella pneumoniae]
MPQGIDFAGDAIRFYRYQTIPLTDYIHGYGFGRSGFKLPASAAWTWDKPWLICETYGNFGWPPDRFNKSILYRAAMELFARG